MSDPPDKDKRQDAAGLAIWEDLEFSRDFDRQLGEVLEEYVDAAHKNTRVLADLSREIRDGLSAVIGYSEMLMEDTVEPSEKAPEIGRIRASAWSLLDSVRQLEAVVSEERYQRRVADILRAIAMVATEATESHDVAGAVLEKIIQVIDCDAAHLCLEEKQGFRVLASWGEAFDASKLYLHSDEERGNEPYQLSDPGEGISGHNTHLLHIPLMRLQGRGRMGMVTLVRHKGPSFSEGVMELASRVGKHVSTTIGQSVRLETMQLHASIDDLTGVLNRRYFFKMASSLLERARIREKPLSLMVLDLDHFKAVNDTHGHLDGDAVLRRVAEVLGENLRSDDVLGRYGGEEFIIILPDTPLQPHGEKAAERLRKAVEAESFISNEGAEFGCTISIGVAELTKEDLNLAHLFQRADQALYEVKANGRNGVSLRR